MELIAEGDERINVASLAIVVEKESNEFSTQMSSADRFLVQKQRNVLFIDNRRIRVWGDGNEKMISFGRNLTQNHPIPDILVKCQLVKA